VIAQPGGDGDWRITCGAATQTKVFPIFQSRTHTHPYNYIIAECQAGRKLWILMDIHRWSIYSTPGQAPLHLSPGNPPQSPTKIYLITPQGSHSHSLGQPPRYNRNYSRHAATLFRELRVGGFVTRQFIGKALEFPLHVPYDRHHQATGRGHGHRDVHVIAVHNVLQNKGSYERLATQNIPHSSSYRHGKLHKQKPT